MSKRRTKKQKEGAKHNFTLSWKPTGSKLASEANVKRQLNDTSKSEASQLQENKLAKLSTKIDNLASIKKDLIKSLILSCLIIGSEVVLYLTWKN